MTDHDPDIVAKLRAGLITHSPLETEEIAQALAPRIPPNQILAFHGDLGVGKTTFIRGLARAWGIKEAVTSPTFNLYSVYQGTRQLVHLDAYRLSSGADLESLMIDDFLRPPWCLAVEWPERIAESLPDDIWHLFLNIDPDQGHSLRLETV